MNLRVSVVSDESAIENSPFLFVLLTEGNPGILGQIWI